MRMGVKREWAQAWLGFKKILVSRSWVHARAWGFELKRDPLNPNLLSLFLTHTRAWGHVLECASLKSKVKFRSLLCQLTLEREAVHLSVLNKRNTPCTV